MRGWWRSNRTGSLRPPAVPATSAPCQRHVSDTSATRQHNDRAELRIRLPPVYQSERSVDATRPPSSD
eukprot:1152149-Prorocentrum_minimum.AAC.1